MEARHVAPHRRQRLRLALVGAGREHLHESRFERLELGRLLDELAIEGVPFDRLEGLVDGNFASHWQRTLKFLGIVGEAWPEVLAERGSEVDVRYNFHTLSHRYKATDEFFGTMFVTLRRQEGSFLIGRKKIVLKNDYIRQVIDVYHV